MTFIDELNALDKDEPITCELCDGGGESEEVEVDEAGEETGRMAPCPACSGFGRLDW